MKIPKFAVVMMLVIIMGGVVVIVLRRSDHEPRGTRASIDDRPSLATQTIRQDSPPAPPARNSNADIRQTVSKLGQGEWTDEGELTYQGTSNPVAAYESLLWASTGGDVAKTADTLFLTPSALRKADDLFASLPLEKKAQYGTALNFIATLFIGASGIEQRPLHRSTYQLTNDEPGAKFLPAALGLPDSSATDSNYHTVRAKQRMSNDKEANPVGVFYRTEQGWKWVMPPSMIDFYQRRLTAGTTKSVPRDASLPGPK
jgi:hypothetical protein